MNERNERRLKARFPRKGVAGFLRIVLMGALAFSGGIPEQAAAHGKKSAASAKVSHHKVSHHRQVGRASWYGPGFHGKKTASGKPFNQSRLTAAHPRLPFGTRARVTNLGNGKRVEVTITDRGPHRGGRIIDLSRAAARRLAMGGTARVSIEALP